MQKNRTVAFHTLGCKLNLSETSTLSRLLENEGFEKKRFEDIADVYVINTCSVTDNADKECRHLVRRIQRKSPDSFVVITGCYAQLKPQEIAAIPGVDLVLGAAEKFNIAQHIGELAKGKETKICSCDIAEVSGFHASFSQNDRTRTFLKVQDGCDYNCSFCTIPMARGKSRSDSVERVVEHAQKLAKDGVKEIVLTGVNLGDFGKGTDGQGTDSENFYTLVKALDQVEGIERYRISSIEPNLLTNEIIELVAGSKRFMPHFHIPLQSGNNRILKEMKRKYDRELYASRVEKIRSLMPAACIAADVIVGFPGETDEEFEDTYQFINSIDISYLHVFTYSKRDHTLAGKMTNPVQDKIKKERSDRLHHLSELKKKDFYSRNINTEARVLFESDNSDGFMHGFTENYIRVKTKFNADYVNTIIPVILGNFDGEGCFGK